MKLVHLLCTTLGSLVIYSKHSLSVHYSSSHALHEDGGLQPQAQTDNGGLQPQAQTDRYCNIGRIFRVLPINNC